MITSTILQAAYDSYFQGKVQNVEDILKQISENDILEETDKLKYEILQGYLYQLHGDFEKGLQSALKVANRNETLENFPFLIDSYIILAEIYERPEKYTAGINIIEKGEKLLQKFGNEIYNISIHNKIWLLHFKGRICWWKGAYEEALGFFRQALDLSSNIQNKYDIAVSFRNVGLILTYKGEIEKSLDLQRKALLLSREIENKYQVAWSLQNLGGFMLQIGNFDQALMYFKDSL